MKKTTKTYRARNGKFTRRRAALRTQAIVLFVLLAWAFGSFVYAGMYGGAVDAQAYTATSTAVYEPVQVIHVQNMTERTPIEVVLWYTDSDVQLLRAIVDGNTDAVEAIMAARTQYAHEVALLARIALD